MFPPTSRSTSLRAPWMRASSVRDSRQLSTPGLLVRIRANDLRLSTLVRQRQSMKRHFVYAMGFSFAISATVYGQAGDGKPLQFASREPAFYAIMGSHIERTEARSVAALRRHIALQLKNATVPDALHAIEEQTSLRFAFKPAILPQGPAVSLDAQDITVAAALTQILLDADV